jgi:hypothetical protein
MTTRGKTIHDALYQLLSMWSRSPLPNETTIQEILTTVYEAGYAATPDFDGARWRLLEKELGNVRAQFNGYRAVAPTIPRPSPLEPMRASFNTYQATQWRFECDWVDLSGSADTIPKIVAQMIGKKRGETG